MAFLGAWSIANYPLQVGQTVVVQDAGLGTKTFTTAPMQGQADTVTYTPVAGNTVSFTFYPCEMGPEDIVSLFRAQGVVDATMDEVGRLSLPSGSTLTGSSYLG